MNTKYDEKKSKKKLYGNFSKLFAAGTSTASCTKYPTAEFQYCIELLFSHQRIVIHWTIFSHSRRTSYKCRRCNNVAKYSILSKHNGVFFAPIFVSFAVRSIQCIRCITEAKFIEMINIRHMLALYGILVIGLV